MSSSSKGFIAVHSLHLATGYAETSLTAARALRVLLYVKE